MGRVAFGVVLALVGLLYLIVAGMAVFSAGGFLEGSLIGGLLFIVGGALAAGAAVNLLREKRR